jgi:hypothetical protein
MTAIWKRRTVGAAMGAGGAFLWATAFVGWNNRNSPDWPWSTPFYAAYCVLVASWFVLPLGAVVGTILPRLVAGRTALLVFSRGFLAGVAVGVIAATITVLWSNTPTLTGQTTIVNYPAWKRGLVSQFVQVAASMSTVCAFWVGIWAVGIKRIEDRKRQSEMITGSS